MCICAGALNGPCPRRVTAAARALYLPPARKELAAAALVRDPNDIWPTTRPLLVPPTRTSIYCLRSKDTEVKYYGGKYRVVILILKLVKNTF